VFWYYNEPETVMIQPVNFDQDSIVGFIIAGKASAADIGQ
jgi:hypothetical protein